VGLGLLIWWLTRTRSLSIRVPFRAFAIALAFAPTALIGGWAAFPAPASLVLVAYLFEEKTSHSKNHFDNLYLAVICFVLFWVFAMFLYERLSKPKAKNGRPRI
jgi:hypothetical protein